MDARGFSKPQDPARYWADAPILRGNMKILIEPPQYAAYEYYCDTCRFQILENWCMLRIVPGYGHTSHDMSDLTFCSNECISKFFSPDRLPPCQSPIGTKQLPSDHPYDETTPWEEE